MGKILIVADQGDTCVATSRGLELAAKLDFDVEVVAFAFAELAEIAEGRQRQTAMRQKILELRRKQIEARIGRFATPDQKVAVKVVWLQEIHPWILKRTASTKFDAVVKTSHDSGSFMYTSTDWHLLRECPAPILITAEKKWHRTKPVLATLDLGTRKSLKKELNSKVLGAAKKLAELLGVELKIISAIEVPTLLADMDLVDPAAYAKEHRAQMLPHLKALAKEHGIPAKAFVIKRGPVDKVITSYAAKSRAQLVVMGTVGRQGIQAHLVGNTAESVLHHLHTDVLAIKPDS
ncbi:MAG: universal stress protein [Congregibacter sp.]